MKDLKLNIRFNYLYRDAGNYKVFGSVIFNNPENDCLSEIESSIKKYLIDGEFFDPIKWSIPKLQFVEDDTEDDHNWNEYENIEFTLELMTDKRSIRDFLKEIA